MRCPTCKFENPENSLFCGECGSSMELEVICPHCGEKAPQGFKFCNRCGHDLLKPKEDLPVDYNQPQSYTPKFLANKILTTRSSIEGERKLVTVLSADVAHFTSMSENLDPESVHSIMDGCFRLLIEEIHRYEGTINQFLGDGIMAIFGAPVTHEDHAHRACHAALSIQRALVDYGEGLKKEYGIDFKMRIGLNTGQVVVGRIGEDLRMDYTALGDTTNIAFLVQQIAKPGQIILSERTFRIIKGYFHCEWSGEERLKNREKPVKYCELHHEREKRSRLDVEEEEKTLTRFVNRDEELTMMLDLFERAKKKEGQVICVVGEAGEGKSRLIYEFKKRIDLKEILYLESQCISYGKTIPYYPVVEVMRKSFNISELDGQEKIRRALEVRLKRLDKRLLESVPILFRLLSLETEARPLTMSEPEQAKDVIFEALRLLILSGSQVKPMILVVENLQWMDSTSEEFISYIVESIASFPVFLILTYRVGYTHPFESRSYLRQISLNRFSDHDSKRIIQALIPKHQLSDVFIQLILDKADGNPLYLEEIIKSLVERTIIAKGPMGYELARDMGEIEIPETIQEIVLARVDRLEDHSKMTIQAASVIGREFTLKLLARQEELERQLKQYMKELKNLELVREKSLSPDIEYMFKNIVTKDVIYSSLLRKQRRELHRKTAEAIERLYSEKRDDYLEMLAYHYLQSDVIDKSISYLIQAGDKAKSLYANNEAIEYFRKALDLMDQNNGTWDKYKMEAHQQLADLYDLIGDYPRSIHHYGEGMKFVSSLIEKTESLRKIGMICEKKGDIQEASRYYQEAMNLIVHREYPLESGRIYMNIGWIHNRNGDYEKAMDFCTRGLNIFRQEKNEYETALALNNLAVIHEFHGQWDLAEKCNKESIQLIKKIGDQRKLGSFYISLGLLSWKKGKLKTSKNYFKKSLTLMESIGNTLGMANSSSNLGKVYLSEGNLNKAFSYLEKSLGMFEKMGTKSKLCQNYIALAEAYVEKGELKRATGYCNKGMKIALEVPYPFDQGKICSILGEIAAKENGDGEEHFTRSIEIFSSLGRKYELAVAMDQLGHAKMSKEQKKEGQKYLRDAKRIFKELGVEGY
jgi:class 3 adenylate cyclase/tetratricopeptide (TPR) repeat protein